MNLGLAGHVAVVTGGASGIGRAIAAGFAAEGARVAIWDRSEACTDVAAALADQFGVEVVGRSVDVCDANAVQAATRELLDSWTAIDHLAHAAAIGSGRFGFPFLNLEPGDWPRTLEVNIMGMVHVAHAVAPGMVARRSGTLLFIASVAGQIGSPTDPPYSASKAANINFAQCMAKDLAPFGVRVNTICPGMVQTPLNRAVWAAWNARQSPEQQRSYEDWAGEKVRTVVPLQRWQTPENIADMAVFLCSHRASEVTGQTINVDGGFVMHW